MVDYKEIKCAVCGATFKPVSKHNIYCSKECNQEGKRLRKKARREKKSVLYERKCPICGKVFHTKHGTKKYCSTECSYEGNKRKIKERQKEMMEQPEEKRQERLRERREYMKKRKAEISSEVRRGRRRIGGPLYTIDQVVNMENAEGLSYGMMVAKLENAKRKEDIIIG